MSRGKTTACLSESCDNASYAGKAGSTTTGEDEGVNVRLHCTWIQQGNLMGGRCATSNIDSTNTLWRKDDN